MREDCPGGPLCTDVHFVRAIRPHTEVSLGDCSYLNTCHRMSTCRYVHWVLEDPLACQASVPPPADPAPLVRAEAEEARPSLPRELELRTKADSLQQALPPQWVNADLRDFDVTVLGKYDVLVADPPWAIHQEVSSHRAHPLRNCSHLAHDSRRCSTASIRDLDRRRDDADAGRSDAGRGRTAFLVGDRARDGARPRMPERLGVSRR